MHHTKPIQLHPAGAALLALLLLAGCAGRPMQRQEASPTTTPQATSTESRTTVPNRPVPDAVYTLDAGPLPSQVQISLQAIANRMKSNRDLVIRLEGFVPAGGSREMNISISSYAVERIRQRLVELGVPGYRVKRAPLGEEHPDAPQLNHRRVELFVVPLPR